MNNKNKIATEEFSGKIGKVKKTKGTSVVNL